MLDHGRIHQGHEKEIRDVSTFTAQHVGAARRSIWRYVTLTLRKHVGAARPSIWRDVTLTLRKNQPSRFKHVTSIICYLCFMQYAWRCAFFFFFKFVYSEIPGESAWRVLFRPPLMLFASLAIEGREKWTDFNSGLLISRTSVPLAGISYTLFFVFGI